MLMGEGKESADGRKGVAKAFVMLVASPVGVKSHSRSREHKQEDGLSLACCVLPSRVRFRPLVDLGSQAQPFLQRRCDPHSPTTCCSRLSGKGAPCCGAADGACPHSGARRDVIGGHQAAMFLG
jgi:hypothetical protein